MNDSKKKVIHYDSKQIDSDIFEGSFDQVIDNLKELKEKYQSKLPLSHWCKIEWEYRDYDSGEDLYLHFYRYETDEEFKSRVYEASRKEDLIKQKEIEQLKALRVKYKDLDI